MTFEWNSESKEEAWNNLLYLFQVNLPVPHWRNTDPQKIQKNTPKQTFINVNFNGNRNNFLISQANMGCGWLYPIVKSHLVSQKGSFCIIKLFKFSQLFDSHWKMWSMHGSEKWLKFIYPGSLPQAWIWKPLFSLEFVSCLVCFLFKSTANLKKNKLFSSFYENKPFVVLNICIFELDHSVSLGLFRFMWSLIMFNY